MATGRSVQLTKQVGEYLVAAELCRRRLIATTFTGNVPHYDIVASNEKGRHVAVQVKAIRGGSWQLNFGAFAHVTFRGKRQIIGAPTDAPVAKLICVFVMLKEYGRDCFYVLDWRDLQAIVIEGHGAWLKKHGGVRPQNPKSLHAAVRPWQLDKYEDNWALIERRLRART